MENYDSKFRFTWTRALMVAVVALAGFALPQSVPLEYASLNNPSSGLQYLEITCASNVAGITEIYLDVGQGFNELDKITIPIGPSDMAYTYTFPLVDAPLVNLRIDPFARGAGEITFTNLRIINRRGDEIQRFSASDFVALHKTSLQTATNGWKLVTNVDADDPRTEIHLPRPIVAEGMNERNLKRCLISVSYLTLMLSILLLAIYFTFWNHLSPRVALAEIAFLAAIALFFSFVGNRGLLRNSARHAYNSLFLPHSLPVESGRLADLTMGLLYLEISYAADVGGLAEIFLDTGRGFNENEKLHLVLEPGEGTHTYTLPLPDRPLSGLRMDPFLHGPGKLKINVFRVINRRLKEIRTFAAGDFQSNSPADFVVPSSIGWILVAGEKSSDPSFAIKFGRPLVPLGIERRTLLRRLHLIAPSVLSQQ